MREFRDAMSNVTSERRVMQFCGGERGCVWLISKKDEGGGGGVNETKGLSDSTLSKRVENLDPSRT